MNPAPIVTCEGNSVAGWRCSVIVRRGGREVSRHEVRVTPADLERLTPVEADPERLVAASFEFLLDREPPSSILRSFELTVIGRYEREIRGPG